MRISLSRNSYIFTSRRVTFTPIGMPLRRRKLETSFLEVVKSLLTNDLAEFLGCLLNELLVISGLADTFVDGDLDELGTCIAIDLLRTAS